MKKTGLLTCLTAAFSLTALLFVGCKKESSKVLTTQEEDQVAVFSAESELESQFAFDDIFNNVLGVNSEVGIGGVGIFGRTAGSYEKEKTPLPPPQCVNVTITPQQPHVFPKTVVIDFGTGCTSHGHLRSGKISIVYDGWLIEPGKSATTTFENFKIDSFSIEGTQVITNTTAPSANQRQFKTEIINGKVLKTNDNYEELNASRTITQIEGNGTPLLPADDIFRVTGNSEGKTRRGNLLVSWTSEVQKPLIKRFTCRWLSAGVINTVRNGLPSNTPWTAALDYGNGDCDNKATLTVNGSTHQIILH